MREAARLMAKVFAFVFGAGSAVVVLLYLMLGAYYVYGRIERARYSSPNSATFIETYDPRSLPDGLPKAELDCGPSQSKEHDPWEKYRRCKILIDGRLAALISRDEAKLSLEGFGPPGPLEKGRQ